MDGETERQDEAIIWDSTQDNADHVDKLSSDFYDYKALR